MSSKGKRDTPFGELKLFNERSTNATVIVQLCTTRGESVPSGQNGNSGPQLVPAGTTTTPVVWKPAEIVDFVESVMVDVYDQDGVTRRVTFGPMGVGLQNAAYVEDLRITLSGSENGNLVGTVLVELGVIGGDGSWTTLRSAKQQCLTNGGSKADVTFQCTTRMLNGKKIVLGTWNTLNQSGIVQSEPNKNPPYTTWTLTQVSASPMEYQILTSATSPTGPAAIGVWLAGNGPAKVAGQINPADTSAPPPVTQFILIQYAEGAAPIGPGNYQIVALDGGLAITSVNANFQTQFSLMPPDSPNPPNEQYFNVLGL